ncbi:TPA: hypothetical protein EYP38_00905, partial [Candidatus Micrarchaeota archaeon]|nr:hypothetical protein [Candidatus Micrarchaeota archaeon]
MRIADSLSKQQTEPNTMTNDFALIFQMAHKKVISADWYETGRANSAMMVTQHPLYTVDEQRLIGSGRRLSNRDLAVLRELLDEAVPYDEGWIEDDLLYRSRHEMVWFIPGRVRPMHFRLRGRKAF